MSAKFTDIPADEWEQTYCAEELAEERKADKKERGRVSGYAMIFTALLEAGGVSTDVYQAAHIFLAPTKNHAPDESVRGFLEKDAGARLPGDPDVAYSSLRKRFVRAWGLIEQEQSRVGKCFAGRREKGSIKLASRKSVEKKIGPKYFSQIAQAVVDVQRIALSLRGYREDRYRRAAQEVWAKLPSFTEADITIQPEKPTAPAKSNTKSSKSESAKYPRRLDRSCARRVRCSQRPRSATTAQLRPRPKSWLLNSATSPPRPSTWSRSMSDQKQSRELAPTKKQGASRLQELYNQRRAAQRRVKEIDRLIAEEKKQAEGHERTIDWPACDSRRH